MEQLETKPYVLTEKTLKKDSAKPEFLSYIHQLRGFAILLIVGIHCRTSFFWAQDSLAEKFFEAILDNGTIIFVFISGFLFEHIFAQNFNFQQYLNKKLKFIIVPYLLVSIIPIIDKLFYEPELVWLPEVMLNSSHLSKAAYMLVSGKHFGPYWFIPMIVIFYLISPFLVWINKARFYTFVFPLIFIAGLFTYKFGYYSNNLDSFLYFFPIYLFGMCTSFYKNEIFKLNFKMLVVPILLFYVVITGLEVMSSIPMIKLGYFELDNPAPSYLFNFSKLKVSLLCIALIVIFRKYRQKEITLFKLLGDYSIGVFFIHLYFIVIFQRIIYKINGAFEMNLFIFITYTLLVTVLCVGSIMVIKWIFGNKSRYLVGS